MLLLIKDLIRVLAAHSAPTALAAAKVIDLSGRKRLLDMAGEGAVAWHDPFLSLPLFQFA
eukprot:4802670-Pleurochrysis_carterae.AAC.3